MGTLIKWVGVNILTAIFWVFVLSIDYQGRTLFSYAHHYIIQNDIVQDLDDKLEELWVKVYDTARLTFAQLGNSPKSESKY